MPTPIERFKEAYKNWRYNPFTPADMAVDKEEDHLFIPGSAPFHIQLLELARKDDPTSVTVYCYDDVAYFTEVATAPAQGQFRVDYPPEDGEGTGQIEFNQNDTGKEVKIEYKATGSPALAEFLDTKVSYPAGTPAEHQILGFVSGAPEWRYNPVCYFHDDNVIYHVTSEDESCLLFRFKKSSKQATVILELKGAKLHQGYYTELMEHIHAEGTLAGTQPTHAHGAGSLSAVAVGNHSHGFSATSSTQASHTHASGSYVANSHQHGGVTAGGTSTGWKEANVSGDSGAAGNHSHTVSGTTGDAGNHGHSISGSTALGGGDAVIITGDTANAGVTPKTYPHELKVYINGVNKTAEILALTALTELGDGTAGHAFVTTGTGEMDISALVAAAQFHEIKVTEPTSAKGGRCLLHLEVY